MTKDTIKAAEEHLRRADPILGALIERQQLELLEPRSDYFASLCRSIIGQQVSVAAARAITLRFEEYTNFDPTKVSSLMEDQIKAIGLSRQKATYIGDLAQHFLKDPNVYNHLDSQSDEQVIEELTAVKGIGPWTAQMFLMFTLGRPDVFAPDDVGLQRGMMNLYGWTELPPKKQLIESANLWRPYRTVASLHLWHSLDNKPAS